MKISVKIKNRINQLEMNADTEKEGCVIDDIKYDVNVNSVVLRLYAYTHDWPQNLKNERIIDGESYSVIIESEKEIKKYSGEGSFPTNYNEFKRYIFNIKEKKAIITADCTQ